MTRDYYGTKRITAWREIRDDKPGYAVKYSDGYISWSPQEAFEAAYQPLDALSFGHAIVALKAGYKVARQGWNGKEVWLVFASRGQFSDEAQWVSHLEPHIVVKTKYKYVPWFASQPDMLADDWGIVN